MEKHLYRSASDRWIAGVCGGIAEFTGVPALLIRLLWILIGFCVIGVLLYIAAMFLLPEAPVRKAVRDPHVIDAEFEVKE